MGKKLDGYEWVLFVAGHSERHTKQINEVKADPNFPKSVMCQVWGGQECPPHITTHSRTLLVLRLEHNQAHIPALHGLSLGTAEAVGGLGCFCYRRA